MYAAMVGITVLSVFIMSTIAVSVGRPFAQVYTNDSLQYYSRENSRTTVECMMRCDADCQTCAGFKFAEENTDEETSAMECSLYNKTVMNVSISNHSTIRASSLYILRVHGAWSRWSDVTSCSVSCGGGTWRRKRICDTPPPYNGGRYCAGVDTEDIVCNQHMCPVDGGWGEWGGFSSCTVTCGGGVSRRQRSCDTPTPAHGGADCAGIADEEQACNTQACPIDGAWGSWSDVTSCSQSCGGGDKTRQRSCDSPSPAHGGRYCEGSSQEAVSCNTHDCPDPRWTSCTARSDPCNESVTGQSCYCDSACRGKGDCCPDFPSHCPG